MIGLALDMAGNVVCLASFFVPKRLDLPVTLAGCALWICAGVAWRNWLLVAIGVITATNETRRWWRRRRKRAPKLAGYKARALLAAVVAKLRQSLKPRPEVASAAASPVWLPYWSA